MCQLSWSVSKIMLKLINIFLFGSKFSIEQPHVLLNQFPCESIITMKDCLAAVAHRVKGGSGPAWLPKTFNLQTELPQFVKHYQLREQRFTAGGVVGISVTMLFCEEMHPKTL